jgi:hypothetical protein
VQELVSPQKWRRMWFYFWWEYIVMLIEPIWLCWLIKVEFSCSIGGPPLGFIWVFLSFI